MKQKTTVMPLTTRPLLYAVVALLALLAASQRAAAQPTGTIAGTATDSETGQPLPGVNVLARGTERGASAGSEGRFVIGSLPAGTYTLQARFVGYRQEARQVQVTAGDTARVRFALAPRTVGLEAVEVTARRGAPEAAAQLREAEIQEANPRDAGELIRKMSGVGAVRRGPVGLDPVVRGLRETQVGVYVDGMRTMPAGPARMDSPLSHSGPSTIRSIEVVKGPYALTWGAGNMSAIRVKTNGLWAGPPGLLHGQVQSGYDTNLSSYETTATVSGERGSWAYRLDGAWRQGDDYQSGAGAEVPADFLNREARGKLGYRLSEQSRLSVAGGYQQQNGVDYPGRLLNGASSDDASFQSGRGRVRYEYEAGTGLLRSLTAQAYGYQTLHVMNNRDKPTYEAGQFPNGNRPPPLRVTVNAEIQTVGGRLAAELAPTSDLRLTLGGDAYRAYREATRPFFVVTPSGEKKVPPFYESDQIWPGVTIADVGVFAQATRIFGPVQASGTVRADFVWAGADENRVTDVYLDVANATIDQLDQQEVNLSSALMLSASLSDAWSLSVGGGTAVRTASALERYADRFPANKAQTSAEFIGDPTLRPERSWQADVELEARYPKLSLKMSGFARRIENYITLEDAPDVEPMLPLPIFADGPFRYANGEATFYGGEASAGYALSDPLTVSLKASYLWGQNETTDQPALGVSPLSADLGLRYEPTSENFFVEGAVRAAAEQERVATVLGETPTEGYVTIDLKGGVEVGHGISLEGGVTNLTGSGYVNHLNATNPYTGRPIFEPGRIFFAGLTYRF